MRATRWLDLPGSIRRFPQRLRDRRFWHIQALVLMATAPHYVIETLGYTNPFETLHGLAITLYIIPLLYAALNFGWEGAILTALWSGALTSPSTWIWHRSELHWFTELGQLAVTLPVGILVAWRVDLEAKQRQRAEKTSASLRLLNEVGADLTRSLDVEGALANVPARLVDAMGMETAWICLQDERADERQTLFQHPQTSGETADLWKRLDDAVLAAGQVVRVENRAVAVPLTAEGRILGSLGVATGGDRAVAADEMELLTTVAHQIAVAVDNARLYRQRQETLQSYARQVTEAQEEERKRIARELHDETAQALVALCRGLDSLSGSGRSPPEATTDQLGELRGLAVTTLENVRRFSRALRPSVLDDLGLIPAIEWLVADLTGRQRIDVRLEVAGKPRRLSADAELVLFRVVQEALRNVEKHAQASRATIGVSFNSRRVHVEVSDNGRGFDLGRGTRDLARLGHFGLLGMQERTQLLGGTLNIWSQPGKGTRVAADIGA